MGKIRFNYFNYFLIGIFIAACAAFFSCTDNASAVSACPGDKVTTQPDGTTLEYRMKGDEYFHYYTDTSGNVIQKDGDTGVWKQVVKKNGKIGLSKTAKSGKSAAASGALSASALEKKSNQKAYARLAGENTSVVRQTSRDPVDLDAMDKNSSGTASTPLLTIVIGFNNVSYSNDYDWNSNIFSGDYSIGKYYSTVSENKFTFAPCSESSAYTPNETTNTNTKDKADDGVVHVNLDMDHGTEWYDLSDISFLDAFAKALTASDKYVDFSQFDTDKNGTIAPQELSVLFIVAGYETSYEYYDTDLSIWAHQWNLQTPVKLDGKDVKDYITMGENVTDEEYQEFYQTTKRAMAIGCVAHELGHIIGLPDLYDVDYSKSGEWIDYSVDYVSIMSAGSWGCDPTVKDGSQYPGSRPAYMDPYCKMMLGYIDPEEITTSGDYNINSQGTKAGDYKCYIIPTTHDDEIFIVENRQFAGFDVGMKNRYTDNSYRDSYNKTGGIVLWHIDKGVVSARDVREDANDITNAQNTVNTVDHRPGIMPAYYEVSNTSGAVPQKYYPFYNSDALARYGGFAFNTLLYNGDSRSDRTSSGITVTPVDTAAIGDSLGVDIEIVPAAPYDVTGRSNNVGTITLNWTAIKYATDYYIYRYDGDDYELMGRQRPGTSYTDDRSLTPGTAYAYKVRAGKGSKDSAGAYSNAVTVLAKIDAPTGVAVSSANGTSANVSWKAVDGAVEYEVYRSASGGSYKKCGESDTTSCSVNMEKAGCTYSYKVMACGQDGNSELSSAAALTSSIGKPGKILVSVLGTTGLQIKWSSVAGAEGYNVFRSTSSGGTYKKIASVSTVSYNDRGLKANKKYYYKVAAFGPDKAGSYSKKASAYTLSTLAFSVKKSGKNIKVHWEKRSGIVKYKVVVKNSKNGKYKTAYNGKKKSRNYYIKKAKKGKTYYVKMRYARNKNGKLTWSSYTAEKAYKMK